MRSSVSREACKGYGSNAKAVHSGEQLYVKTVGRCEWGRPWGEMGLQDCVGNKNNEECAAACTAKIGCGAYERVDTSSSAKCCLYTTGSFGNMVQETPNRVCWVRPSKSASCRAMFKPGNTVSFRTEKKDNSWCSLGHALSRAPTRTPTTSAPTTGAPTTGGRWISVCS